VIPVAEIRLEGADALIARLDSLDAKLHRSVIGKASRVALKPAVAAEREKLRALPFKGTGASREALAKAVGVSVSTKRGLTVARVRVRRRGVPMAKLVHLFEWGFTHVGGKAMPDYLMATKTFREQQAGIIARFADEAGKRLDELDAGGRP